MLLLTRTPTPVLVLEAILLIFAGTTFIIALLAGAVDGMVLLALAATTVVLVVRLAVFIYTSQ